MPAATKRTLFMRKPHSTVTKMAAIALLVTAILGYLYCSCLGNFFTALHYYQFENDVQLSQQDFSVFLHYLSAVLFVYYICMTVIAGLMILRRQKQCRPVLFFMAALKLTAVIMMLVPSPRFAFHFGFESIIEVLLLIHLSRLASAPVSTSDPLASVTPTILAAMTAEFIPLLRNIQCLPAEGMGLLSKISFILLPLSTMFAFFSLGLHQTQYAYRRQHKPAVVVKLIRPQPYTPDDISENACFPANHAL